MKKNKIPIMINVVTLYKAMAGCFFLGLIFFVLINNLPLWAAMLTGLLASILIGKIHKDICDKGISRLINYVMNVDIEIKQSILDAIKTAEINIKEK